MTTHMIRTLETLVQRDTFMRRHSWSVQDAKNRFSDVVKAAQLEPQTITKYGKPTVVVIAASEYERLQRLERLQARSFADLLLAMPSDGMEFDRLEGGVRDSGS